ncbi:MAG: uroporphyrinogen decarboxylase family protein, partial [Anaerolineae bacterium]
VDISYWPDTLSRWEQEGLPPGTDPRDYFGLDRIHTVGIDSTLRLPTSIQEETESYRLEWDANGVLMKAWKSSYAPPAEVDWRITSFSEWRQVRHRLAPGPDRLNEGARQAAIDARNRGSFVVISPIEPAWFFIRTVGAETALPAMLEEPEFFDDVLDAVTELVLGMLDEVRRQDIPVDALWFFSDLCYRNGMLFSPRVYRRHVLPRVSRICEACHAHGLKVIYHCDGHVSEFIPLLIEAGVDCLQPLEARAGNDVRDYRKQYGHDIAFFGNINADVVATGDRHAIEEEVRSKIGYAKEGGGYLYHIDHSVPPGVSFAAYSWLMECVRKYGRYD